MENQRDSLLTPGSMPYIFETFIIALSEKNLDKVLSLFSADIYYCPSAFGEDINGIDNLKIYFTKLFTEYENFSYLPVRAFENKRIESTAIVWRGLYTKIPGKEQIEVTECSILNFTDGLISRYLTVSEERIVT